MPPPPARAEPAERLRQARDTVRASLDADRSGPPPPVTATVPIRPLPDEVGAKIVARAEAGLVPAGSTSPRSPLLKRVVLPSATLALLDAVLLVVAAVQGATVLAIVAAVLLVAFATAAVVAVRYVRADPLLLDPGDHAAIAAAGRWTSDQPWPADASGPEVALVATAAEAAQRVVSHPAWLSGLLARGGVQLSLGSELDLLDRQAHGVAVGGGPDADEETWTLLVTRVAALTAYAATLDDLDSPLDSREATPLAQDVERLAFFLSASIYEV